MVIAGTEKLHLFAKAGFSRKDYRIGDAIELPQAPVEPEPVKTTIPLDTEQVEDDFSYVNVEEIKTAIGVETTSNTNIAQMLRAATEQADNYIVALCTTEGAYGFCTVCYFKVFRISCTYKSSYYKPP